ncbi:SWIM zinc finger family protein [uncultured Cytophaga sp.]|mgnify:CR=1 FL=1|uniref:SWIM zinc finger family protein n=1 Tax=uncultured Cytophaga sp. TaxID=160238 RepID=UPI00261C287E|nr:SWIM zinc finger family protein [uncultured Cytophaga sp.]
MHWQEEQVIALSPDDSSLKSGKDLAKADKWQLLQKSKKAIWGECKGSGAKPYQTQIDLNNIAFKCSCPSRKFPCKHGLGLFLLFVRDTSLLKETEAPEWVSDWLKKREEKSEKKTTTTDSVPDEVAQEKRSKKREANVEDGIAELHLWMKDMIRNGLIDLPSKPASYFENMARRLIDAQAPGLSRMVRQLGETNFFEEHWEYAYLDLMARMYMLIQGFTHLSSLPSALTDDIRSFVGFTQSQEALKEQKGILDHWLVLSVQIQTEDEITTERYWLWGSQTNTFALVLQFIVRGQGKQLLLSQGIQIEAELVFYPSAAPLRALIKRQVNSSIPIEVAGLENWDAVFEKRSNLLSLLPFLPTQPFIIENVQAMNQNGLWYIFDKDQRAIPIPIECTGIYKWLSISGGVPVSMSLLALETNKFMPLGIWHQEAYYSL